MKTPLRTFTLFLLLTSLPAASFSENSVSREGQLEAVNVFQGLGSDEAAQKHIRLGDARWSKGENVEAEEHYIAAVILLSEQLNTNYPLVAKLLKVFKTLKHEDNEIQLKLFTLVSEKYLGSHTKTASAFANLGDFYTKLNRFDDAERAYIRALEVGQLAHGQDDLRLVPLLEALYGLLIKQTRTREALIFLENRLLIFEKKFGEGSSDAMTAADELALLYLGEGQYLDAERLYKHILKYREKELGVENPSVAVSMHSLAAVYIQQFRNAEAEQLLKQAIAIKEKKLGLEHPSVATSLSILGLLYRNEGRYEEVESLTKRALAIREKQLGPWHTAVATSLINLAWSYRNNTKPSFKDAETMLNRAIAINERNYGPDHSIVATSYGALAELYFDQGRLTDAELLSKRELAINENKFGAHHLALSSALNHQAEILLKQGRLNEAEALLRRILALREKNLVVNHPGIAGSLTKLSLVLMAQHRYDEALPYSQRAFQIIQSRIIRRGTDFIGDRAEKRSFRNSLVSHLALLEHVLLQSSSKHAELQAAAFETVQLITSSTTGEMISKTSALFADGTDQLAQITRDRQESVQRIQELDVAIGKFLLQEAYLRNQNHEQSLQVELVKRSNQLIQLDKELAVNFPKYVELIANKPVSLASVQKLLNPQEALLVYTITKDRSYLFLVRSGMAKLIPLDTGLSGVGSSVQLLRQRLAQRVEDVKKLRPYDSDEAFNLYRKIFAPAEDLLKGVTQIMLVLDGPLQSFPFSTLVDIQPNEKIRSPEDHQKISWLSHRFSFTTLPSISALNAFRSFSKRPFGNNPFIGFGDPVLLGPNDQSVEKRGVEVDDLFRTRSGFADVGLISKLAPLPDTAEELISVATLLNADTSAVFLQKRATEENVKTTNLLGTRVLAFSTHGAMSGEIKGFSEPGLILTPPKVGTALDDGYLSASEITQLKLNAEWVLLSACNTAAPDGHAGAEGLSGLAKSFFYAGARSLLVSHWPVDSGATRQLVTNLFKVISGKPDSGKADALNQAAMTLMSDAEHPYFAHPYFWAPFVIAGDSGPSSR